MKHFQNRFYRMMPSMMTVLSIAVILGACSGATPAPELVEPVNNEAAPAHSGVLVLGKITDDPVEAIEEYQPIANCLVSNLGEFGIGIGEVKTAPDIESMAALVDDGQVHVVFDNAFSVASMMDLSNGEPIVLRVKEGPDTKQGFFFALPRSGFSSLQDLMGHVIAFQSPSDIVAYLGARVYMMEAGLNLVPVESADSPVGEDQIGYIFSGDPETTLAWVLNGKVLAGVVESDNYEEAVGENLNTFVILAKTEALTRNQPGLAPKDMDPALKTAIANLLIDTAESCPDTLAPSGTLKFSPYTGDSKADVERVVQMFQLIQDE
jgi:phosphonate transport system substrate-binding protein